MQEKLAWKTLYCLKLSKKIPKKECSFDGPNLFPQKWREREREHSSEDNTNTSWLGKSCGHATKVRLFASISE